jgi:hypothetical protein
VPPQPGQPRAALPRAPRAAHPCSHYVGRRGRKGGGWRTAAGAAAARVARHCSTPRCVRRHLLAPRAAALVTGHLA